MTTTRPSEGDGAAAPGPDAPVLRFTDVSVRFATGGGEVRATSGITFDVRPAEVVAVVGESGSGKSVSALSSIGLLPRTGRVDGSITLDGRELLDLDERRMRSVRGNDVAVVFQEPMTALNPVFTVGWQLAEVLRRHLGMTRPAARDRARELLELVGIPDARRALRAYPHQLSGGQRQRVVIAMAVACDPKVLIADEPTTALDVTVQAEILDLLRDLRDRLRTAIVLITHDMGVVADLADRVVVMYRGEIVEQGDVRQVLTEPRHPYTARLLAAVPHLGRAAGRAPDRARPAAGPERDGAQADPPAALELRDLVVEYGAVRAVRGVSLRVDPGEVLGLVGESGSGKSTVGRCAAALQHPTSGTVHIAGRDVTGLPARRLRPLRRDFSIVFQDPASSLDPRMTVGDSVAEPLRMHRVCRGRALAGRVAELLDSVALGAGMRDRYPHELSGGQRQRVSIARALALEPRLLIADEPTSALDVSVQAEILDLFLDLQRRLGFGCLFISHDLAVVELLADRVAVMRGGEIVESGPASRVLGEPDHPYTRALLAAAPVPDPDRQRARRLARAAG
ncbi:ABC transporter ATP-binding protein [Marinitenerispora sediminis]|uniref:Glutathione ABC transporter ATP-binding protein n=1 Tax=Marinitenerispora sediminis TaxID=1931232 RepID=A0A368T6R2_9ACTN|nr:ABC transporter ATP-binding protein [Marinitenerispora sediminis]RCV52207.1 glutathione ABC transporter ATP-binding protein [Marinitenerispora sediminis]RCV55610.1 glutathione ABC transporter ATP-binding protein [Marinitenerispora sediminis]RCV59205.1 glutathione ABC transporter ATP-binding protein [Marinitenerispora sediminis]